MSMIQELLVEGNDDLHVVMALCQQFAIKENFKIIDSKGIDSLMRSLPVRLKGSSITRTVGVIIDADMDADARWQSVRQTLIKSGMYSDIPENCPKEGLILSPEISENVRFGLWLMPDNNTAGMLENFTTMLIPDGDQLLPIVDETLSRIEGEHLSHYSHLHHEKARIHTWLSWQETPGIPMGLAITRKYLTATPPICSAFVEWLRELFG